MVEAEFAFLEMRQERASGQTAEAGQSRLGKSPESFDVVDVIGTVPSAGELVAVGAVCRPGVSRAAIFRSDLRSAI